ncbi:TPA: cell division protein FtsZ, partial [Streptococcus pyogenes]|nr:cell division protein FtsZ [Streptococcus pyogenes]
VTGGLDMTLTEAEEASEIVGQAAGQGVNIWLGTSIDDTMKDDIRVTVVATGVRQEKAEQVSGFRQPRTFTQTNAQQVAGAQYASDQAKQSVQPGFDRRSNFDFDMGESREIPSAQKVISNHNQNQGSAFGNWDLRRDNISRPTEGELDNHLNMSTFSANDDSDDELETPPFFKNR